MALIAAESGDVDRAGRIVLLIENPYSAYQADTSIVEKLCACGDFDGAEATLRRSQFNLYDAASRMMGVLAARSEYDRAVAITTLARGSGARGEALLSIAAAAISAGDTADVTRILESVMAPQASDGSFAKVAESAVAAGDEELAARVVRLIQDPSTQASAWLALAHGKASVGLRRRAVAQALRLEQWHHPVEPLINLEPSALGAIVDELAALGHPVRPM